MSLQQGLVQIEDKYYHRAKLTLTNMTYVKLVLVECEVKTETIVTSQCNCLCHDPNEMMMHIMPCCYPGTRTTTSFVQLKLDENNNYIIKPTTND